MKTQVRYWMHSRKCAKLIETQYIDPDKDTDLLYLQHEIRDFENMKDGKVGQSL